MVGEAASADEAVRLALRLRPHVVVVDGGTRERTPFELARTLTSADRRQRVLLVAWHDDPASGAVTAEVVERAWECGIHGIVDGTTDGDQLAKVVDQVRLGRRTLPPRPAPTDDDDGTDPARRLTRRERQVLAEIAHGYSTTEAGTRLALSPATVKHHLSAAHRKLGARSRLEAVMLAVTQGLIQVDPAEVNGRRSVTPASHLR